MQEFAHLQAGDRVFKLVGPVLVPKELDDARGNVTTRIAFIAAEMCAASLPPLSPCVCACSLRISLRWRSKRYQATIEEQEKEREAAVVRAQALQQKLSGKKA